MMRRGMHVQPFKCGPDYIDTQFQSVATGHDSINLDLFMASEGHVKSLFSHYSSLTEVAVVEGVMGMLDGYDGMNGSSAHIALTLGIPVILLVNAASSAYSVAATIYGFTRFNQDVKVAGVIFNRVASESHFSFLRKACADVGVECFGYLRKNPALQTPSRHLGLTLGSKEEMNRFINLAADEVENNVDIDMLLDRTMTEIEHSELKIESVAGLKAAVARDEAFNFIYPANLQALGDDIRYFSPLHDRSLPNDADIVYFPGGYPELFARQLEENRQMRQSVKDFVDNGGRVIGECGGLIYLCREIDGHKMCGIFPLKATMADSRLSLGYRTVVLPHLTIRGHEFHYSKVENPGDIAGIARQFNVKGEEVSTKVYRHKNTLAGYTHLYWAETGIMNLWKS